MPPDPSQPGPGQADQPGPDAADLARLAEAAARVLAAAVRATLARPRPDPPAPEGGPTPAAPRRP